jgi:hypothetical protein
LPILFLKGGFLCTNILPLLQLIEYVSFIQIGSGNPHSTGELIGLSSFWQAHVSAILRFVGVSATFSSNIFGKDTLIISSYKAEKTNHYMLWLAFFFSKFLKVPLNSRRFRNTNLVDTLDASISIMR